MSKAARISYVFVAVILLLVGVLHLSTLLLTVLFAYFALQKFSLERWKRVGVVVFLLLLAGAGVTAFLFIRKAYVEFPEVLGGIIQAVVDRAEQWGVELPFTDFKSLRETALQGVTDQWAHLGRYASFAVMQSVMFLIGLVVALSLFVSTKIHFGEEETAVEGNLYAAAGGEILKRFATFYRSFATVMGAQLIISLVNTALTAIFLVAVGFHHASLIVMFTFLCGLLPIIGNLMSNTLIVCVGLTLSPKMALTALIYLVVIHKLEYFLNSKIIGSRIKNPMWMTMIGLILGEKLMGVPGMILAPVVLHYVKVEASRNRFSEEPSAPTATRTVS